MTVKEIHKAAKVTLKSKSGSIISLSFFSSCIFIFLVLCEIISYFALKQLGYEWIYSFQGLKADKSGLIYWISKIILFTILLLPENAVLRRLFIDLIAGTSVADTRMYISAHSGTFYIQALYYSFIPKFMKFFALVPAMISSYGIYYWGLNSRLSELTSSGLFGFMMCLGFTLVWLGVWIHYCISLALTPYIMALNPRSNIFDACDLSVRLMEGQHIKYLSFLFSFVKFIPLLLLVYPIYGIHPYYKVCYILFMEDIMGDYHRDKMPGMIKRWKKYLE